MSHGLRVYRYDEEYIRYKSAFAKTELPSLDGREKEVWERIFGPKELFSWTVSERTSDKDWDLRQITIPKHIEINGGEGDAVIKVAERVADIPNVQSLVLPVGIIRSAWNFLYRMKTLTALDLSSMKHWPVVLDRFDYIESIPNLQTLILPSSVDDTYLKDLVFALASKGRSLQVLSLVNCKYVTDEGISAVVRFFPTLRRLDLRGTSVTDRYFGSSLMGLEELNLSGCFDVTPLDLETSIRYPNVHTKNCGRKVHSLGFPDDGDENGCEDIGYVHYRTEKIWNGYCAGNYYGSTKADEHLTEIQIGDEERKPLHSRADRLMYNFTTEQWEKFNEKFAQWEAFQDKLKRESVL